MEMPLLQDIVVIFLLSIAVVLLFSKLRFPAMVGFLLTGIIAGPHGFGLVGAVHEVEALAEVGVILLLFTIGLEFSLESLLRIRRAVLLGGSLQVLFTIILASLLMRLLNLSLAQSVFVGFLVSLSSTAIVLKLIQERAEVESPHGRTSLAILIFQDIMVVPMMLLTPILAGVGDDVATSLLLLLAKAAAIFAVLFLFSRYIVPPLFRQIAGTRSRELFLLSIVAVCFSIAWLTSTIGLSLALGAFLAGLIISESEYAHWAMGNVMPFRDILMSFVFISIGMLLDPRSVVGEPFLIVALTLGVLVLKTLTGGLATGLLGLPLRAAVIVALTLSQIGEFSFLLSVQGVIHGLMPDNIYQIFIAVTVLSMAIAPFVVSSAPRVADFIASLPLPERLIRGRAAGEEFPQGERLEDHVVIIGFGVGGRNVARAAKLAGIPYGVIEMNAETVRAERDKGEPIFLGDAVQEAVLEGVNIRDARVVVVVISDPAATRRVISIVRGENPSAYIIARTRFVSEVDALHALGADEVIPEEFETSIEIFTSVLNKYLTPRDEIERFTSLIRREGYQMLRSPRTTSTLKDLDLHLADINICTLRVEDESPIGGKTPAEINLRSEYGINLLAIYREQEVIPNPGAHTEFRSRDVLVVIGAPEKVARFSDLLAPARGEEKDDITEEKR